MSQVDRLVSWIVLVAAIAGIVYPAFVDERMGLTQIVVSLFRFEMTLPFAMRWLCVVFALCLTYIIIVKRIYRNTPLTIISTIATIKYNTNNSSEVTIERVQLLRPNRPDVTAYYGRVWPEAEGGSIKGDSITGTVVGGKGDWHDRLEKHGSAKKGYELIHDFGKPLPYSWYMPLIPYFLLNEDYYKIPKFISRNLVIRRQEAVYLNEYSIGSSSYSLVALNYPQHYVRVHVVFSQAIPQEIQARRIKTNGVVSVEIDRQANARTVSVHVDRMYNETLRISW